MFTAATGFAITGYGGHVSELVFKHGIVYNYFTASGNSLHGYYVEQSFVIGPNASIWQAGVV